MIPLCMTQVKPDTVKMRFEKVNASAGNVYLCKGMGRRVKGTVVDMESQTLP